MYFRLIIFFSNRQLSYNVHYYQHKPTEYFEVTGKNKKVYFHRINEQWYYRSGEIPPYLFTSFTRALATTLKQKIRLRETLLTEFGSQIKNTNLTVYTNGRNTKLITDYLKSSSIQFKQASIVDYQNFDSKEISFSINVSFIVLKTICKLLLLFGYETIFPLPYHEKYAHGVYIGTSYSKSCYDHCLKNNLIGALTMKDVVSTPNNIVDFKQFLQYLYPSSKEFNFITFNQDEEELAPPSDFYDNYTLRDSYYDAGGGAEWSDPSEFWE